MSDDTVCEEFKRDVEKSSIFRALVIREESEFDSTELRESWNRLNILSGGSIFQTYEWNRTWWNHFGTGKDLSIILIYREQKLIAIFPLFIDRVQVGGINIGSVYRLIGSNLFRSRTGTLYGLISYTDYLDLIIDEQYRNLIERWISLKLHDGEMLPYDLFLESVPQWSAVRRIYKKLSRPDGLQVREEPSNVCNRIDISDGWDELLRSYSKNRRKKIRRELKKADTEHGGIFRIEQPEDEHAFMSSFDELAEMHQERWNRVGALGTFYEKANLNFHRDVALKFYRSGWAGINRVSVSDESGSAGKPACIDLNYHYNGRIYGIHTAINEGSPYYQESPGSVLLYHTLKNGAIKDDVIEYDFLRGGEAYKLQLSNRQCQIYNYTIMSDRHRLSKWISKRVYNLFAFHRKMSRESAVVRLLCGQKGILTGTLAYAKTRLRRSQIKKTDETEAGAGREVQRCDGH
jgi:CelD/BcsL family acetyltransferase involved in cellulose biosynthesis